MKIIKKTALLLFCAVIIAFPLAGCRDAEADEGGGLTVISTIFPGYDFARAVCGENAEVRMLLPPGGESHSYEPTAKDMISIRNCDLFIYTGGESDTWVETVLASFDKPVRAVKMTDCVDMLEEEIKEGMEAEEDGKDATEYDEHVWTSPKNAVKIVEAIADAMCEVSPGLSESFRAGQNAYTEKLNALDEDFTAFFATAENKTLIIGDRFPLLYFTAEYGLDYYAAFPGCAAETEPSAATIAFLVEKAKATDSSTVFYIEFSNHLIADEIAAAAGGVTAQLNTCHNVTKEQFEGGVTYIDLMRENLETLKGALKQTGAPTR